MNLYVVDKSNPNTLQILLTCKFLDLNLNIIQTKLKNQTIVLQTPQGILNQPNTIIRFLAKGSNLQGTNKHQKVLLNQWFQFFNTQLYPLIQLINNAIFGHKLYTQDKYQFCLQEVDRVNRILDDHLKMNTVLVGNNITIVDICFCVQLQTIFRLILTQGQRKKIAHLNRWYQYVRNTQPFLKLLGRMILCPKESIHVQFQQIIQKQLQQIDQQEKQSNKSGFQLDTFKRDFVNADKNNKPQILSNLYTHFEEQNWSIWKIHYQKDVTQGKVDYLTKNLANGTIQRLEGLRKNGFGVLGVYGVQNQYQIRGVMMWKGTEISKQWKQHPSYDYHKFTKLNIKDLQTQKLINSYWLHEESAQGLPFVYAKYIV